MRLYGSLNNRLMERAKPQEPKIGMGATELLYSDRRAVTIVEVSWNKKTIVVQRDNAERTDNLGMTDCGQAYRYSANPNGARYVYTLRKNGAYVRAGESLKGGTVLLVGERDEYYDFSF